MFFLSHLILLDYEKLLKEFASDAKLSKLSRLDKEMPQKAHSTMPLTFLTQNTHQVILTSFLTMGENERNHTWFMSRRDRDEDSQLGGMAGRMIVKAYFGPSRSEYPMTNSEERKLKEHKTITRTLVEVQAKVSKN